MLFLFGSCQAIYFKKAKKAIEKQDFELAIDQYKKLNNIEYSEFNILMLADLYFKLDKLDSSENYYKQVITNSEKYDVYRLPFAITMLYNRKINEAKKLLETKDTPGGLNQIVLQLCNSIYNENESNISPIISYKKINIFTNNQYKNGNYSTSTSNIFIGNQGNYTLQFAYEGLFKNTPRSDGKWIPMTILLENPTNRIYDGQETYSTDGNTVIFSRSIYSRFDSLLPKQKIFSAKRVNDQWTNFEEFPYNSDTYSIGQVCMSKCNNLLYFSSDMPGGYGGFDLYYSELNNGSWSKPINLGSQINSSKNELFPYIDSLNLLYYSSNKDNSDNQLDAFISYNDGVKWLNPISINHPLQLSKNDYGFSFDPNNSKSILSIDTKETKSKEASFTLLGRAIDKETQQPIEGATVEITTGKTGELIRIHSDQNGNFRFNLSAGINYRVFLKNNNSFTEMVDFSTKDQTQSINFNILYEVETICLNKSILLLDSNFDNENYILEKELKNKLDELILKLRNNSDVKFEIASHTDQRGNHLYNHALTLRRSKAVSDYLFSQGIQPERIQFKGYGPSQLIKRCDENTTPCDEQDYLINRRIEYKIIGF